MRLFPAANRLLAGVVIVTGVAVAAPAFAQTPPASSPRQMTPEDFSRAMAATNPNAPKPAAPYGGSSSLPAGIPPTLYGGQGQPAAPAGAAPAAVTQSDLKNPDSPHFKAHRLADRAKATIGLFGALAKTDDTVDLSGKPTPPEMNTLQNIHKTFGSSYAVSDDLISKEIAIDMRRDAQREAALSYGARGGLAKRSYQIMERLAGYEPVLDGVFDFRQLLIKAPSGLLIEPPIVRESLDSMVITENGNEAAVADQVLKINQQAKIVATARNWRQYLTMPYDIDIAPPPRVLWPKNRSEQAEWDSWVREGWLAGYEQGEESFEANLNQLIADYNGMVRYRMLLAQGKISQPYAMHEDRGVTGGRDEMRVGDRALRITGPSQFLTGADQWKPADR